MEPKQATAHLEGRLLGHREAGPILLRIVPVGNERVRAIAARAYVRQARRCEPNLLTGRNQYGLAQFLLLQCSALF